MILRARNRWGGPRRRLAMLVLAITLIAGLAPAAASARTVVSLTFDDGLASQSQTRFELSTRGMNATYFVNSGLVGTGAGGSARMTWSELDGLYADGNDIGGKTVDGTVLTGLTPAQQQQQICNDRSALQARGYDALSFAYPGGAYDPGVQSAVRSCGYTSARGFTSPGGAIESIPPADFFGTRTAIAVDSSTTAGQLQALVAQAEAQGNDAWVQIWIGRVCGPGCDVRDAIQLSALTGFLDWLAPRWTQGTTVEPVSQVIGESSQPPGPDTTPPASRIRCNAGICSNGYYSGDVSVSLASTDYGSRVAAIRYTTDGSDPTESSPLYNGAFTVGGDGATVKYRAWDHAGNAEAVKSQAIRIERVAPQTTIRCDDTTCASSTYERRVSVSFNATDAHSGVSAIRYTTDGTDPTSSSQAYTAPFWVPRTADIKFRAYDNAGNVEPVQTQHLDLAASAAGPTVVSLTFDDGKASQHLVRPVLKSHGMHGTFYANSALMENEAGNDTATMTWAQLHELYSDGNEVAGHTLNHVNLPLASTADQQTEICDDRQAFMARGFNVTNFAYPYGLYNAGAQSVVRACGYDSARTYTEAGQPNVIEGLPPGDRLAVRTVAGLDSGTTLPALQKLVTDTERDGGGWVVLVVHRVCGPGCDVRDAPQLSTLNAFLDWVQPRAAQGTLVQSVQEALGNAGVPGGTDTTPPASSIGCDGRPCIGWAGAHVSVNLSATDDSSGVAAIRYTTDGSDPTSTSTIYAEPFSVSPGTTIKYRAWDLAGNAEAVKTHTIQLDSTAPTTTIACNGGACQTGTYTDPTEISLAATDAESGVDVVRYTTDGSDPTSSSAVYTGPFTVPLGTTVKYRAWDRAGTAENVNTRIIGNDSAPPTSSIACNGGSCDGFFRGSVSVSLSAADDDSGVDVIRYTTNGSDPVSTDPIYSGAFTVSAATTVKYRAWDRAGNVEAVRSQQIRYDTAAPLSSIDCNGSPCANTQYAPPVTVALSATDSGSGVDAIRYTTDGSNPSTASPAYTSPILLSSTTTIKFRAWDNLGNVEAVRTQVVTVGGAQDGHTVVSLAFDDGQATQFAMRQPLLSHGMRGSFFINSGLVGTGTGIGQRMTWTQIHELYSDGNEVGGHTVNHPNLTTLATAAQQAEVCNDRQNLRNRLFNVVNFAYPEGAYDSGVQAVVQGCGYSSARGFPGFANQGVPVVEPFPPADLFGIRTVAGVDNSTTVEQLQNYVTAAEQAGGGWVIIVFHRICGTGCDAADAPKLATVTEFLDWLQPRAAQGTVVKTIMDALDNSGRPPEPDTTAPTSSIRCNSVACPTWVRTSQSITLNADDAGAGVGAIRYTTDGTTPTSASRIYAGAFTVSSPDKNVVFRAWDLAGNVEPPNTTLIRFDTTAPATTISCNGAPCTTTAYSGSVSVALNATDSQSGVDVIRYTTNGSTPGATSPIYTGPIPLTASRTVRFRAYDKAGNVEATKSQAITVGP